ncbi:MAG: urate hydroxylase PuuD [Pseudomonadota bacterium]
MDIDVAAWLNLVLRWLHLIAGIAWIGSSFYFIWLDNHLRKNTDTPEGVAGSLWAVHGGGFYHKEKYLVAPAHLPAELHWFKWEAYTTWISGFFLLILIYYWGATLYLIDPAKLAWSPGQASAAGLGFLIGGWLVYDRLCRSPIGRDNALFGVIWFAILTAGAYFATRIFSDRGAFIHVGAVIGTVMAANVFMVIIPNQKKMVAAMLAGETPDAALGIRAKQRSLHNNYMTLPVLFIMISGHYPMTFSGPWNWAVLAGLGAVGWMVRHFFNLRHKGRTRYDLAAAAVAGFLGVALVTSLARRGPEEAGAEKADFAAVRAIIARHCLACHSAQPSHPAFDVAPMGLAFDTAEEIRAAAPRIKAQTVDSTAMPLSNETGMSAAERRLIGRWVEAGAKVGP